MGDGIVEATGWELDPADWMSQAACTGVDPDLFFPPRGRPAGDAVAICGTCPVQSECLAYAVRWRIAHGIWGGRTEKERRRLAGGTPRPRRLEPSHGTTSRYRRGCHCVACRDAHWQADLDRRAAFRESDHARTDSIRPDPRYL